MNLRDLQYFVAVADHQHFGRAAEACNVSQPTLSMQLRKLEDYLGVALLERGKQVMVTAVGEQVLRHARAALQHAGDIRQLAKTAQDPFAGELRLGAFPTFAPYFLPLAVPRIHKALPKLKLLLVEEKTPRLIEQLRLGALDAAFLALPIEEDWLDSRPLIEDPFLLAVPKSHPLAGRKRVSERDMRGEQLLLLEDGHCLRSQTLQVCSLMGAREEQEFRATSLETLRQMVAAGVGITLIPQMAVRKDANVAYIPFTGDVPSRTIGLVWRKQAARSACIHRIGELLQGL